MSQVSKIRRSLCCALPALFAISCGMGPRADSTGNLIHPVGWKHGGTTSTQPDYNGWWRTFGSTELNRHIQAVDSGNLTVDAARARLKQAAAIAAIADATLFPTISGSTSAGRQVGIRTNRTGSSNYDAGINASYELDLWGGNAARRRSALHGLDASRLDLESIKLTTRAGIASLWFQVVALRERESYAKNNLENSRRVLGLVQARRDAGAATSLELAQQKGFVAQQEQELHSLRQQGNDALIALANLAGVPVQSLEVKTDSLERLAIPRMRVPAPSLLLVRRPDIARSEALLLAADADIAVARSAMLPNISFTSQLAGQGNHYQSVVSNPVYGVASALTYPIFNAGRLAAEHDISKARREELLVDYRSSVVSAFNDVESALNAIVGLHSQHDAQNIAVEQARRGFEIAEFRYKSGAENLLTLLDSQRTLSAAEDSASQLKVARMIAAVSLYRALGGGFDASK